MQISRTDQHRQGKLRISDAFYDQFNQSSDSAKKGNKSNRGRNFKRGFLKNLRECLLAKAPASISLYCGGNRRRSKIDDGLFD